MKKLFLLSAVFLLSTATFATTQTDTTLNKTEELVSSVIPDSASLTFKEVYSDIKSGINALSASLKVGSEHVYALLVKQQMVKSVLYLTLLTLSIVLMIILFRIYKKALKTDWSEDTHIAYFIFLTLPTIIFFCGSIFNIDVIITGFINPEYGAIKEILDSALK